MRNTDIWVNFVIANQNIKENKIQDNVRPKKVCDAPAFLLAKFRQKASLYNENSKRSVSKGFQLPKNEEKNSKNTKFYFWFSMCSQEDRSNVL